MMDRQAQKALAAWRGLEGIVALRQASATLCWAFWLSSSHHCKVVGVLGPLDVS